MQKIHTPSKAGCGIHTWLCWDRRGFGWFPSDLRRLQQPGKPRDLCPSAKPQGCSGRQQAALEPSPRSAFPCPQTELLFSKNEPRNPDLSLALSPGSRAENTGSRFFGCTLSSPIISPAKHAPQPSSPFNLSWHPLPPPRQGWEENSLLLYQNRHKGRVM